MSSPSRLAYVYRNITGFIVDNLVVAVSEARDRNGNFAFPRSDAVPPSTVSPVFPPVATRMEFFGTVKCNVKIGSRRKAIRPFRDASLCSRKK